MSAPSSPIWSEVETPGSINGPAFVHLACLAGRPRILVRKVRIWASLGAGNIVKVRRTTTPIDLNGAGSTIVTPVVQRMDERNTAAALAEFLGTNFTVGGATFTRAQSQWQFPVDTEDDVSITFATDDFSAVILPGSAMEFSLDANGAGNIMRVHAVWDEGN